MQKPYKILPGPHTPLVKAFLAGLKILLVLLLLPGITAWELPWLSQRVRADNDFHSGNYELAIEHYNRVIESDGNAWELLYNLGTSYYKDGQWDKAVEHLTYASQIAQDEGATDIEQARIFHNLGLAHIQLDDCENAVPALARAVELNETDEDIARNFAFAQEYCADSAEDAPKTEGEEEDTGEGDDEADDQGQSDEGETNDENEAQTDSECDDGEQEGSSGEPKDDQEANDESGQEEKGETGETGDTSDEGTEQGGEGEQDEQAEQDGADEQSDEPDNGSEDTGKGNESDDESDGEGEQGNEDNSGSGNAEEQGGNGQGENGEGGGPRDIPADGLNLSDGQVQDILDRMSDLEQQRAQRYFHNSPMNGELLDDESILDLLQRLFLGIEPNAQQEAEDGIDW